jgi:hypothetical protein
MADNLRHAAGQPTYEVREVLEHEPAADLGMRFSSHDFSEAIELALDFLESEDPDRSKVSALQIVKVQGERREVVWSYSHSLAPATRDDLIRLWGFDPTRPWHVPSGVRRN